ncbi:tyrosine-type recombinase/integrase [Desulfomonile tiedjei]|uniref:Site-specific recombinase XerD n=1 Tax=Desulfomonile tiedjei (strain ATCC 49306 / DSM 6799 / DCB-1) TaxID=706587 RepID=I4C5Q2_DESTA|nr:tyrosine-type recombinase/integrase [Desulfomonile tiedjei]AFM24893.1 site-specific recombinase XerD [Desulfomonile tiedjei DSM 6799]
MVIIKTSKGQSEYALFFYPFTIRQLEGMGLEAKKKKVLLRLPALKCPSARGEKEAKRIEALISNACKNWNFSELDSASREACGTMFRSLGIEVPASLGIGPEPRREFTLKDASKLFLTDPEIRDSPGRWRHEASLLNLVPRLGANTPVKLIKVAHLKQYQNDRLRERKQASTINRELATLSKLFRILVENDVVDVNPVRSLKALSTRSGERQVYLSFADVQLIASHCPKWYQDLIWTAYYTGARRGELLALTRKQVDLAKRIIVISPMATKEAHWKRIPIHQDLLPTIEPLVRFAPADTDNLFLLRDSKGARPIGLETFKNCWDRALTALEKSGEWKHARPRFHDLRHTWRTNARRSGIDFQIAETILGHQNKARSVSDRYGRISDKELLEAIEKLIVENGETEVLLAREITGKNGHGSNMGVTVEHQGKKKATQLGGLS